MTLNSYSAHKTSDASQEQHTEKEFRNFEQILKIMSPTFFINVTHIDVSLFGNLESCFYFYGYREPKEICTARFIRNCPPLAEKFLLVDVSAIFDYATSARQWSDLAKQFFKANIEGRIWEAIPVAMYGEHQGVRLVDSNNRLLADILIEEKFAGPATFEHCEGELPFHPHHLLSNIHRIVFFKSPFNPRYKSRSVPDKPISVVIACYPVVSFKDRTISFHIAPIDEGLQQEKLQKIDKFYSALSHNDLHEDLPRPGTPCVARYTEDGRYYRAEILSIVHDIANILFVDYGNQQKTPLSALKRITPAYLELPPMAWQCKLKGVKFIPICPEFMEHFDRCFGTTEELSASFHAPTLGDCGGLLEVDLSVPKIGDVSQFLMEKHVVERVSKEADVE